MLEKITPFNLEKYKVTHKISKNKFGTLYRAYDTVLERHVALKVLAKEYTKNPKFIANFFHEARIAGHISHPNMVQIYDISEENNIFFITSEYIDGTSLEKYLAEHKIIPLEKLIPIILDICNLLKYVWEKDRLCHKNITSKYILMTRSQHKLNHLALNTLIDKQNSIAAQIHYYSPEQISNKSADFRCDIYHLGIILYKAVTGVFPFDGNSEEEIISKHLKANIPNPQKYLKSLPNQFNTLINKMLAKHPNDRYSNYYSLIRDIKSVQNTIDQNVSTLKKRFKQIINSPSFTTWFLIISLFCSFSYNIYVKLTQNLDEEKLLLEKKYEHDAYNNLKKLVNENNQSKIKLQKLKKLLKLFFTNYPNSNYKKTAMHWHKFIEEELQKIIQRNKNNNYIRLVLNIKKPILFEGFHIEVIKRDILSAIISQTFKTNKFSDAKLLILKDFSNVPIEYKNWKNFMIENIDKAEKIYTFITAQKLSLLESNVTINKVDYTISRVNNNMITLLSNVDESERTISIFDLPIDHINHITNNVSLYRPIKDYNYHLASFFIWAKRYKEAKKFIQKCQKPSQKNDLNSLIKTIKERSSYARNRITDLLKDLSYYIELGETNKMKLTWAKLQKFVTTKEYEEEMTEIREKRLKLKELKVI